MTSSAMTQKMLATLTAAQTLRKARANWHEFEMQVMLSAVNRERETACLGPIALAQLERVESMACGHSDYSHKRNLDRCRSARFDLG